MRQMPPNARPLVMLAPLLASALAVLLPVLGGCRSAEGPTSFAFPASEYAAVLDATREESRAMGYTLERVDAARGEVLTAPKTVPGLASPFEPEYGSPVQVWRDTLNAQPRTVRVRFRDAAGAGDGVGASLSPEPGREIVAEVEAVVWRERRPGWRLETESVRRSTRYLDPQLAERGVTGGLLVPLRRDDGFASEVADSIRRRAGAGEG